MPLRPSKRWQRPRSEARAALRHGAASRNHFGVGLDDEAYVYVTTTGRISGQPRTIEIWFVRHGDCIYLLAEHFDRAHWVKNIRKNPRVGLRLASREVGALARVLEADRDSDIWKTVQNLAKQKYGWGDGHPVEIRPDFPLGDR